MFYALTYPVHCYFTGFITIFEKLNATFEPLARTKSRVYYFNFKQNLYTDSASILFIS